MPSDILGVLTGYIGGAVLTRLLEHPEASTFNITVLTRSSEKAKLLGKNGVTAVVGSLDDRSIVEKLASEADYAFAIVSFLSCCGLWWSHRADPIHYL
jgi:uncharacterized protein YbjT (DUF2867 family)